MIEILTGIFTLQNLLMINIGLAVGVIIGALKAALAGSAIGGIISAVVPLLCAPQLAKLILNVGSPEYYSLCVFGLFAAVGIAGEGNVIKGVIAAFLGLMLSTVGMDTLQGIARYMFGLVIGAVLGTGGAIAAMFSYTEARRASKNPKKFGEGSVEGVLAPETANNAVTGAALIPCSPLAFRATRRWRRC